MFTIHDNQVLARLQFTYGKQLLLIPRQDTFWESHGLKDVVAQSR
jgi:hypothetical protein